MATCLSIELLCLILFVLRHGVKTVDCLHGNRMKFALFLLHTVQLISKLTLMCSNTRVFLYFCCVTWTKLACDTRVIFRVEHASFISCAAQDPSSCAARL